jgi:hypothetical protein
MKKTWLFLVCVLPSMCFAQATVSYTLKGHYIAELSGAIKTASWSKTVGGCADSDGTLEFATGGSYVTYPASMYGTLEFTSTTAVSVTMTSNVFNQSKSNATVQITWGHDAGGYCVPTINDGHGVFDPPATTSASGSYSINAATGIGPLTLNFSSGVIVAEFQTTGSFASCASGATIYVVPSTIMLETRSQSKPNVLTNLGLGMHVNELILACPS